MSIQSIDTLLAKHPFFQGLQPEYLSLIGGCASNVQFQPGEQIFREGQEAHRFFLVRYGRAALEIFAPDRGAINIQTVQEGDVLGWSWLIPPFRWRYDARAVELVRAFAFDGACLRGKCDTDPALGYELMQRFAQLIARRLHSTQLQLIDVYGDLGKPTHAGAETA